MNFLFKSCRFRKACNKGVTRVSEKGFLHCDLRVIAGAGPSGLISAYIAGLSGANVILVEEDYVFGGNINNEEVIISKLSGKEWINF